MTRTALRLGLALWLLTGVPLALAQQQQPVTTQPLAVTSVHADGAITMTNTFQSVFASNVGQQRTRAGCTIQNTGTHVMYVYVGVLASATEATSYQLTPPAPGVQGGSFSCATGAGGVLQDQISITGTTTETFAAEYQ